MEVNYTKYYLVLFVLWSIQFLWYSVTLPGSNLSPDKKHPKPKLKTVLTSYLIYILPTVLMIYYLRTASKPDCNKMSTLVSTLNTYISTICKK